MGQAARDANSVTTLIGVSNADGITPVTVYVDPTTHRVLTTTSGSSTPGGSDTQVQFNDAGSLAGDAGMTYNKTTDALTVVGVITSAGITSSAVVRPSANDSAALGSAAVSWADLFLASGALINYANGDAVITHSAGVLTVSTGDLRVTTAGTNAASAVTVGGTQTLTNKTLTAPVINTGTVGTSLVPTSDDGAPLGDATHNFSDLFLASGALIKFASTDAVITHSAGVLTVSTGDLRVTTAGTNSASVVTVGGTQTLTAKTLTSPAINTGTIGTSLVPTSDDGAALGNTTNRFSDLFLAEGGVINWDNGDATMTQTSNDITIAGITTFGVGTSTAVTLGTIELGAASDTTISRVSAGLIAVEGVTVVDVSTAQTLTNKTLTSPVLTTPSAFTTGGTITLAENTSVALDPAGSADGRYTGITVAGTAGEALAFGDVIVLDVTAGKWFKGSVSAAAGADGDLRGGTGMCVLAAAGDASATTVLLMGTCRADANFPALTIGSVVYATTSGDITVTQPTTTDHIIKVLGYALTADEIMFCPSMDYITHT